MKKILRPFVESIVKTLGLLSFVLCFFDMHNLYSYKGGFNCKRCGIRKYLDWYDADHWIFRLQAICGAIILIALFIYLFLNTKLDLI